MKKAAWGILALLAGACGAESDGDASIDARAVEPVDGYVDVGGINLHYRDYRGTGDLLLFVPGFFMTAHVYDQLGPHFTDRYRVLASTCWPAPTSTHSWDLVARVRALYRGLFSLTFRNLT